VVLQVCAMYSLVKSTISHNERHYSLHHIIVWSCVVAHYSPYWAIADFSNFCDEMVLYYCIVGHMLKLKHPAQHLICFSSPRITLGLGNENTTIPLYTTFSSIDFLNSMCIAHDFFLCVHMILLCVKIVHARDFIKLCLDHHNWKIWSYKGVILLEIRGLMKGLTVST